MARKNTGGALAQLAAGFGQGYMQGLERNRKNAMEDKRFALEQQRAELDNRRLGIEIDRADREAAMHNELKQVSTDLKPVEAFSLQTPEGSTVFADRKQAEEALAAAGNAEGVRLAPIQLVGGKQFDDPAAAQQAADQMNSPVVRNRRSAEVAMKYGNPQLAQQYAAAYKTQVDANRAEMRDEFMRARATGDLEAAAQMYNNRFARDGQVQVAQGQDGQIVVQRMRDGEVVSATPMGTPAQFWDQMDRLTMATPDNALELWKADKEFGLRGRQVAAQEAGTAASVDKTRAEIAQMPEELRLRGIQANAAAAGAGAAAMNAQTARIGLTQPKMSAVPDAKGNLHYVQTQQTYDPKTGQWGLGVPQTQAATGMRYPAIATNEARNPLAALGGLGGAQAVDWNAIGDAVARLPPKNFGGNATAAPPVVAPSGSPGVPQGRGLPATGMGAAAPAANVPAGSLTPEQQRYLEWAQQRGR